MVKIKDSSTDENKLELYIEALCKEFHFQIFTEGWTRKTYDIYKTNPENENQEIVARIESHAVYNGEIRIYDDIVYDFAMKLGEFIEKEFAIQEASVLKEPKPF